MEVKKISENEIEVTKSPVVIPVVAKYRVEFLKAQRAFIINQRDEFVARREAEIVEVDFLLAECLRLNVVEKIKPKN